LYGSSTSLTISKILFNEGHPCALVKNGSLSFPTGVNDRRPPALELDQNVPNPFNPRTEIIYRVGTTGGASLRIYSADGGLVRTLADGPHKSGLIYRADWDGTDDRGRRVASGVYFYRLENAGEQTTRKMLLLK
jgi:FlgD Ig-like domain